MSFDYVRVQGVAQRMIERYGAEAKLIKPGAPSGPAYDPTPGAPSSYDVKVVIGKFSTYEVAQSQGRILATDKQLLMMPADPLAVPAPGDKVALGAETLTLIGPDKGNGIETIAPGGTSVLYIAQARK